MQFVNVIGEGYIDVRSEWPVRETWRNKPLYLMEISDHLYNLFDLYFNDFFL